MKGKSVSLTIAERCRNVLTSNWRAHLNTIKADAKGSKEDIHTSKVHYMFKKGKPYLWVPEEDLHNTNTIIDERGSLAVISSVPGPLVGLLRSMRKSPARIALAGDVIPVKDGKTQTVVNTLRESILLEHEAVNEASYTVSAILSSASMSCRTRSESFVEMLNMSGNYVMYKFNIRSCTYVDGTGDTHDIELQDVAAPKADLLLPFSEKIIDGINQSQTRRRALIIFCWEYHNEAARDALMLSIDQKGFDVLGKVPILTDKANKGSLMPQQYMWKEFRFTFKEEATHVEDFCRLLVELEEEALQSVNSYSGLG